MKKYVQFALATGHVFELPTQVIADNRAAYYHQACPDEFPTLESAMEDTVGCFENAYDITDWMLNNMNADAVMLDHGRLVGFNPTGHDWQSAETSLHDESTPCAPVPPEKVFDAPVELLVSEMASSGELCAVRMLNGTDDGHAHQAIVVISGGPVVVNRYITSLQITSDLLTKEIDRVVGQKH